MSSKPYTGPSVAEMLHDKTLAENIIKYHPHPTSDNILDDNNLNLLQQFVEDSNNRDQILKDEGVDDKDVPRKEMNLVAYVVWAHGQKEADGGVLKESDIELLRKWFADGKKAVYFGGGDE